MLSDSDMISLMVNEPSWEDVIVRIVAEEGMDPWAVDIVKLADGFGKYMENLSEIDLRIPARFILVAAILLRMKSDILAGKRERNILESEGPREDRYAKIVAMLSQIPPLQPPVKRQPLGSVTMEELLAALKKAFEVQERRRARKLRLRRIVERHVVLQADDINERIENLMGQINNILAEIEGSAKFSSLVKKWDRENIVKTLMPMLHLEQDGKIETEQTVLFEEIAVRKKVRKE